MPLAFLLRTALVASFLLLAPVEAAVTITTNNDCYTTDSGEPIRVSFVNDSPTPHDWIGIYAPNTNTNSIPQDGLMEWAWSCGSKDCRNGQRSFEGVVNFDSALGAGDWKAVLVTPNNNQWWAGVAESPPFALQAACSGPAPVPTAAPIGSPSPGPPPTLAPVESPPAATVATNQQIYSFGQAIVVDFSTAEPQDGDWVGIFAATTDSNAVFEGELWTFVCNRQSRCPGLLTDGTVTFGAGGPEESWFQSWPIQSGTYRAYLLRLRGQPYPVIAESTTFTVQGIDDLVTAAAEDIRALIQDDPALGPKFVRLGFHDCVGGCDGCVDMLLPDNFGLEIPIRALVPVVGAHENLAVAFSRADLWALAALVGADMAERDPDADVDFDMEWIGRQNCEVSNAQCFDSTNVVTPCTATRGPHRELPPADITTGELFHFFSTEFGFGDQETVALLGAHTLGVLTREHSGFDGQDGWVREETILDNEYYFELVGNVDPDVDFVDQIDLAPPWVRGFEDNGDLADDIPDRFPWVAFPDGRNGQRIVMLNADIALVRELDEGNLAEDGSVSCGFIGDGRCPHAARSLAFACEYRIDNTMWLIDFQDVFTRMLTNGYGAGNTGCGDDVCLLSPLMGPR